MLAQQFRDLAPRQVINFDLHGNSTAKGVHIQTSFGAVYRPSEESPVLTTPLGSTNMILHSAFATGLCSTPFGTTNISPVLSSTRPSRNSIVIWPSRTMKTSSVSLWLCQTNSPSILTSLN